MNYDFATLKNKRINDNVRTAIIYSIDDLLFYIVEIRYHHQNYFIGNKDSPKKFGNLKDARMACLDHQAEEGFLALSKTYDEVDSSCDNKNVNGERFDYINIKLNE